MSRHLDPPRRGDRPDAPGPGATLPARGAALLASAEPASLPSGVTAVTFCPGRDMMQAILVQSQIEGTGLFADLMFCTSEESVENIIGHHRADLLICAWPGAGDSRLLDFLDAWRSRGEMPHLPVLVVTEQPTPDWVTRVLEHGAADCFSWQISAAEFTARLRNHLVRQQRLARLHRDNRSLARQALSDPLTQLFNRAYFDTALASELARARRYKRPVSLVLLDLDHFKEINDRYGHQTGDAVLQLTSRTLKEGCRCSDTVCRFGGEEFAVLLPETPLAGAFQAAERLRGMLLEATRQSPLCNLELTATFGVSSSTVEERLEGAELILRADRALYAGKAAGRNRTELFAAATEDVPHENTADHSRRQIRLA